MSLELAFWLLMGVVLLIVVPIAIVGSAVQHYRGRGSQRKGSGGISAGIGSAMLELDRILARPGVEHQVETEQRILKREDDTGGD